MTSQPTDDVTEAELLLGRIALKTGLLMTIEPFETDDMVGFILIHEGKVLGFANSFEDEVYYIDRTNDGYHQHGEPTIDEVQVVYDGRRLVEGK